MKFIKMHGIGNDFVIIRSDLQDTSTINGDVASKIYDRHFGIGCDQLILVSFKGTEQYDVAMKIYNQDGSPSEICGNATRCVALLWFLETKQTQVKILSGKSRILEAQINEETSNICINMGKASEFKENFAEEERIPCSELNQTNILKAKLKECTNKYVTEIESCKNMKDHLKNEFGIKDFGFGRAFYVDIGNPHIIFMPDNIDLDRIKKLAPIVENHPLFPNKVNVSFMQKISSSEYNTISQIKLTKDSGADESFKDEDERVCRLVRDLRPAQQKNEGSFKSGNWYNTISQIKSDESFKSEGERVYTKVHDRDRDSKKDEGSFKNGNWYKLVVWERGVGLTLACGSAACASAYAAYKAGLCSNEVNINLPGGDLKITIDDQEQIYMTGPASIIFTGELVI